MEKPRLSIVVPVYNEERTVGQIIDRIHAACGAWAECIFVDDGSTDGTLRILREKAGPRDHVLTKPNGGKGSAVRMGYAHATGVYTIVQDADLEYSPEEIPALLAKAEGDRLPVVFGSRRLKQQKQFAHLLAFIGGSILTHICNILYGTRLTDQPTCYKMVRTDILHSLVLWANDFRFDPELTALLARRGIPIAEHPISYHPRSFAEGKKIGLKDWFLWVWELLRLWKFPLSVIFLGITCLLLVFLWLPGVQNPVVSDTVLYARLGQSLWTEGRYAIDGVPYAKHLPLHAFLSYPLTASFGMRLGMHLSSLLGGYGVLVMSFLLLRRLVSPLVGMLTTLAVLFHPGFLFMAVAGSADLLFTTLFLMMLFALSRGEHSERWFFVAGILAGLASVTRYNGLPFFLLIPLHAFLRRRTLLRSGWLWCGLLCGGLLLGVWFLRNALIFGNPLFTAYTTELASESDGLIRQLLSNIGYYALPYHNIFALLPFAVLGLLVYGKQQLLLSIGMVAAWIFTSFWWVQAMRFAFPGYVSLLAFAVLGLLFLIRRFPSRVVWIPVFFVIAFIQGTSVCLYTYGACNAWFDRTIGLLPRDMKLSTEGFHTWNQARDFLNARAPKGATVAVRWEIVFNTDIFRKDLQVVVDGCPAYRITQRPEVRDEILFATDDRPVTYVTLQRCP